MKLSLKIWLLAIAYQTIIFALLFHEGIAVATFIPIGLIGGLPGLLFFTIVLDANRDADNTLSRKWIYTALGAFFSASITAALTLLFFLLMFGGGMKAGMSMLIIPSGVAALLSLFTFYIPVNKLLKQQLLHHSAQDELTGTQYN